MDFVKQILQDGWSMALRRAKHRALFRGFVQPQNLIGFHITKGLPGSARPADINFLDCGLKTKSEMHSFVARREIAPAGRYGCILFSFGRDQFDRCADCVPIAFVPYKIQSEPVISAVRFVVQDVNWTAVLCDHSIELSIVVNVAYGHSPTRPAFVKSWPRVT